MRQGINSDAIKIRGSFSVNAVPIRNLPHSVAIIGHLFMVVVLVSVVLSPISGITTYAHRAIPVGR